MRAARNLNATAIELWPDAQFGGFTSLSAVQMHRLVKLFGM